MSTPSSVYYQLTNLSSIKSFLTSHWRYKRIVWVRKKWDSLIFWFCFLIANKSDLKNAFYAFLPSGLPSSCINHRKRCCLSMVPSKVCHERAIDVWHPSTSFYTLLRAFVPVDWVSQAFLTRNLCSPLQWHANYYTFDISIITRVFFRKSISNTYKNKMGNRFTFANLPIML